MAIQPIEQGSAFAFRNVINNNFNELDENVQVVNTDINNLKVLSGNNQPTESTKASKGQMYLDTSNGKMYYCSNVQENNYTWKLISNFSGNYEDLEHIPAQGKVVLYSAQALSPEEKTQARTNIDAQEKGNYLTSNSSVTFTQASSRTNIATTDSISTILGKIKKYFADLGTAAFKSTGISSGSIPINGAELSTTANTPVVVNSSGSLITHASGALGTAAFKGVSTSDTNSSSLVPTCSVVYNKMNKSGGTFSGTVYAGSNSQSYSTSLLRNCKLSGSWSSPANSGEITWVYE